MKKLYSTIMLLAMMVTALGLTACGGGDDDDELFDNDFYPKGKKTITINGKSYYSNNSSISQTNGYGMYITVYITEDALDFNGILFRFVLPPSKVSEINVGDVFSYEEVSIRNFDHATVISIDPSWDAIDGSITIKKITENTLTISLNNLVIASEKGAKYTINGTAVLTNGVSDSNGNDLPFSYG